MRQLYTLLHRGDRKTVYVRFWNERTRRYDPAVSSGEEKDGRARAFAARELERRTALGTSSITLGAWLDALYGPDCPHCQRMEGDGRPMTAFNRGKNRQVIDDYLRPDKLCRLALRDIRRSDILDLRARLLAVCKKRGIVMDSAWQTLRVAFHEAHYREIIPTDPSSKVRPVKVEKKEKGIFSDPEFRALFGRASWANDHAHLAFLILGSTGMRQGEMRALRWENVSLEKGIIYIVEGVKAGHRELVVGGTKSGKGRRAPIPASLVPALESVRLSGGLVFSGPGGKPFSRSWFPHHFYAACLRIGITGAQRIERKLSPHSIRHTVNNLLLDKGADPAKVRSALGWTTAQIQSIYTHDKDWDLSAQAALLDEATKNPGSLLPGPRA